MKENLSVSGQHDEKRCLCRVEEQLARGDVSTAFDVSHDGRVGRWAANAFALQLSISEAFV